MTTGAGDSRTGWSTDARTADYLSRADRLGRRDEGEATLVELLGDVVERVLDLGGGDGRLTRRVLEAHPGATATLVDVSPPMLRAAAERFAGDARVTLVEGDLARTGVVAELGTFDVIVSGLAIHHLDDRRKHALYAECAAALEPGGLFANLDLVTAASPHQERQFRIALGHDGAWEDPEDQLAPLDAQLGWLRDIGLADVDCYWKWRGIALMCGWRAGAGERRSAA